jgi:hypothetical protein
MPIVVDVKSLGCFLRYLDDSNDSNVFDEINGRIVKRSKD